MKNRIECSKKTQRKPCDSNSFSDGFYPGTEERVMNDYCTKSVSHNILVDNDEISTHAHNVRTKYTINNVEYFYSIHKRGDINIGKELIKI